MADPTQKGTTLIVSPAPTFSDFIVVEGTWKETDPLAVEETKDGGAETINLSGSNPGIDAACDLVIKNGHVAPAKLDQLTATFPDASTKKFHVMDVEVAKLGGKPVKCSVKLQNRTSMTYV